MIFKRAQEANEMTEADRLADQTRAMMEATERRLQAMREMPGLGDIRADRTIPIRSRRHSVRHRAIR